MIRDDFYFSFIIPVYNRPEEIRELLESLTYQKQKNFEVIVVEDGSSYPCREIVESFQGKLKVLYLFKPNSGPGLSRNFGVKEAKGNYIIFLDSDCILPNDYLDQVIRGLEENYSHLFGGPDKAMASFTPIQKAINYSMTSMLTTGGIRGKSEKADRFYPRSFNMGVSKMAFEAVGGFSDMRFGEDIYLSIRLIKGGYEPQLIKKAYVYHKRRTHFRQFFKQIYNSGIARINLFKLHPESLKIVHFLPLFFTASVLLSLILSFLVSYYFLVPIALYTFLVFLDASILNKNWYIGLLAVAASYIQLGSYGMGFFNALWNRVILKKKYYSKFEKNFYQ